MGTRKVYDTADGKPLWGAAKKAHDAKKNGKSHKKPPEPKPCACKCGEITKGGEFAMGHDARHKSALIREAKAGNQDAVAELERRGWTKFLEKSIGNDQRKKDQASGRRVVRVYSDGDTDEDRANRRLQKLERLKRAHWLLLQIGRAPRRLAGDRYIQTTWENYEAVLTGDLPELTAKETKQIRSLQGIDAGAKV